MKSAKSIILTLALGATGAIILMSPIETRIFASSSTATSASETQSADAKPSQSKDWTLAFPEDPTKSLVVTTCGTCHGLSQIVTRRGDKTFWSDIVSTMISNGADISDDDAPKLIKYFSTYLDPSKPMLPATIDVNKASVEVFRLLTPLAGHAEDIVKTRDTMKGFKKLDDLLQAPGLTKEDLDKAKPFLSVTP